MPESEVLVLGGGLAGATAALAAAHQRPDSRVRLVTAGESTFALASGLVDVLGRVEDGPVADPYAAMAALPSTHPYRRLGVETVREGLSLFDDVVGDSYCGASTDRNALVPTAHGYPKPVARYPRSVAPGLASADADVLLVGFEQISGLVAPLAARRLERANVPLDVSGTTVRFPAEIDGYPPAARIGTLLDENPILDDDSPTETTLREALVDQIMTAVYREDVIGLPAVLGLREHAAVRADLEDLAIKRVFEVPMGSPSLPGRRLGDHFVEALDAAGVRVETGGRAVDAAVAGNSVSAVTIEFSGQTERHETDAVVLATGGLVGGGLRSDRAAVHEPVFDCHVTHPENRQDWTARDPFAPQPFARFGVSIDEAARPLDATGDPEYANLYAAGGVVGGADVAAEKSASGVSLATGYVAGTRAAE